MAREPAAAGSLAARIDALFAQRRPPGRRPYSNEHVVRTIRERGGPTISGAYLWQLRTGKKDNPSMRHLAALAGFFEVPVGYFFDEPPAAAAGRVPPAAGTGDDEQVRAVAQDALGLSADSLGAIRGMIRHARRLEGLPETASATP